MSLKQCRIPILRTAIPFVLLTFVAPAFATPQFTGRVVAVRAGDILRIHIDRDQTEGKDRTVTVRLHGVIVSSYGRARRFVRRLALGKRVEVTELGDSGQRILDGWVMVGDRNVSYELLKAGLARWDRKRAPGDRTLQKLERPGK